MTIPEIDAAINDFRRILHYEIDAQARMLYRHPDIIPARKDEVMHNIERLLSTWATLHEQSANLGKIVQDIPSVTITFERPALLLNEDNIMDPLPEIPKAGEV